MSDFSNEFIEMRTATLMSFPLSFSVVSERCDLTFFYDESNNSQSFSFRRSKQNDGWSFNDSPFADFCLAGVMSEKPLEDLTSHDLLIELGIVTKDTKDEPKEFKASKHFAGDFLELLDNERVYKFLDFIDRKGLYIHYSIISKIFFTLADIADGLGPDVSRDWPLKTVIYECYKINDNAFRNLMGECGFPNVEGSNLERFYLGLAKLFSDHEEELCARVQPVLNLPRDAVRTTIDVLKLAAQSKKNPLLEDNDTQKTIPSFSCDYIDQLIIFAKCKHVFDKMCPVEKEMHDDAQLLSGVDYSFVDSKENAYIQVADGVSYIIAKCAVFSNSLTQAEVEAKLSCLKRQQRDCLKLLRKCMERSYEFHPGLLHYVTSASEVRKLSCILFKNGCGGVYAPFLR